MKRLALDKKNHKTVLEEAVKILRRGGIVVYPTETAYGLGADFFNLRAWQRVYKVKGRNYNKPLPVIAGSLTMAKVVAKFNQPALKLAKKHWPGALTIVLDIKEPRTEEPRFAREARRARTKNQRIKESKNQRNQKSKIKRTLALRVSSNKFAASLARKLGRPIVSTSANVSGRKECYSAGDVIKQFKNKKYQPDLIIDAGELPRRKASTVVRVIDGKVKVLRKGAVTVRP